MAMAYGGVFPGTVGYFWRFGWRTSPEYWRLEPENTHLEEEHHLPNHVNLRGWNESLTFVKTFFGYETIRNLHPRRFSQMSPWKLMVERWHFLMMDGLFSEAMLIFAGVRCSKFFGFYEAQLLCQIPSEGFGTNLISFIFLPHNLQIWRMIMWAVFKLHVPMFFNCKIGSLNLFWILFEVWWSCGSSPFLLFLGSKGFFGGGRKI